MSAPIHVGDLKDQTGMPEPRPILYCRVCGEENSANAGDYFHHVKHHVFTCCDQNMELVVKRVVYEPVKP